METAGLVLGTVSLLASFKGAIDGYSLMSDIATAFEGASYLMVKLRVEKERLRIWGDYYGFNNTEECARLKGLPESAQSLILYVLMEMKMMTTDAERLRKKYGVKMVEIEKDVGADPNLYRSAWSDSMYVKDSAELQARMDKTGMGVRKSIRWTISEGPKFEKLVDRLEYLNDSLERIVPRSDFEMLALGLSSYILPAQNTNSSLSTIQKSDQLLLASCATMKHIKLTTQKVPAAVTFITDSEIEPQPQISNTTTIRSPGSWTRPSDSNLIEVLIEWQEINRKLGQTDRDFVYSRIQNLAGVLAVPKPSLFCLLPCLGILEDSTYAQQYTGHKRVAYVFQYPEDASPDKPPVTLGDMIRSASASRDKAKKFASLGDRFRLAQSLASAILLLHSSKWLHRNLKSDNIMLFSSKVLGETTPSIRSPYLCGFEFARPDQSGEPSLQRPQAPSSGTANPMLADPYLHPTIAPPTLGRSSRLTDIYALGALLFEIGIWRPLSTYAQPTPEETRALLLHNAPLLLPGIMGQVYADVVQLCLNGDFGPNAEGDALDKEFWKRVVRELDSCRA